MHQAFKAGVGVCVALIWCGPAGAVDGPVDWSGFYLGAHVGAFTGTSAFSNPAGSSLYGDAVTTPGFAGGLQAGYNWLAAPQWVLGVEAEGSILSAQGNNTCLQSTPNIIGSNCKATPRETLTFAGRVGYLPSPGGRTMLFAKGGGAWLRSDLSVNPNNAFGPIGGFTGALTGDPAVQNAPSTQSASTWGWTVGAGVEYALAANWSLKMEYDYLRFANATVNTPATISVTPGGAVTGIPGMGATSVAQDLHFVKLGLNYRWGGASRPTSGDGPADSAAAQALSPGWEFELGGRYWYSWAKYQGANGATHDVLVSRLTYDHMPGHSGEVFGRLDSPFNVFAKGFVGGGVISGGTMVDEDWGHGGAEPESYSNTQSGLSGSFSYLTADLGYNLLRAPDHKVGAFVGYNRYQISMDAHGCAQTVPIAGTCSPAIPSDVNGISETDTWHSLRVGVSGEARVTERLRVTGDIAYLPYTWVQALDTHWLRGPLYFPVQGNGQGVQAELFLSYQATEALSIGIGGRYWAMWTTNAYQTDNAGNAFTINTERYGVLVQASWKFGPH
jgi:opacity protein-like surface antigen/outer membrane protease